MPYLSSSATGRVGVARVGSRITRAMQPSAARGETSGPRPFHKRGTGCAACPRCWRSSRTAVSSSCSIEQRPTSRCVCSFTPTADTRAIPATLPSPARPVELPRANGALSEIVHSTSQHGGDSRCPSARRTSRRRAFGDERDWDVEALETCNRHFAGTRRTRMLGCMCPVAAAWGGRRPLVIVAASMTERSRRSIASVAC
jgi:hypothetical protein